MPSYWWQCDTCKIVEPFNRVSEATGVVSYIRKILLPSDWDQMKLVLACPKCGKSELRITYDFPVVEQDRVQLSIRHIVGLKNPDYLPMMWETQPLTDEGTPRQPPWFDFKYIKANNPYGLNKPAVFTRAELKELFQLYEQKCGGGSFP